MWLPFADNHNIPPGPNDPRITPRIIVVHTMAGWISGAEARFKATGLEAHLGFAMDGRIWQWRDTDWQADAQAEGNGYCISFEFEDGGDCMRPFSPQQEANFYRACKYLMPRYGIPAKMVRSRIEHGFGYHRQFPEWNPNNHACPCDTRQQRLINTLVPNLQKSPIPIEEDNDMSVFIIRCDSPARALRLVSDAASREIVIDTDELRALEAAGIKAYNLTGNADAYDKLRAVATG